MSQNADTAHALEGGWGVLSQNADMLTLGRERVGELKHRASICGQILEVINKLRGRFKTKNASCSQFATSCSVQFATSCSALQNSHPFLSP